VVVVAVMHLPATAPAALAGVALAPAHGLGDVSPLAGEVEAGDVVVVIALHAGI
jgi:hypothetical protein